MKIAILSDIHANIEAFELVMKTIDKDDIDALIAGDLVGYYYHPDK